MAKTPRNAGTLLATLAGAALLAGCKGELGPHSGSGTLELREARLGAQVPGVVLSVRVEEGDSAATGDTLVVLDTIARAIQRDQARAAALAARAQWEQVARGSRAEDIGQAQAQKEVARAQLSGAQDNFQRIQGLASQGAATPAQLESARAQLASSQAQLKALEATADRLVKGSRVEEITRARALWEQAEAALRAAQDQLDRSVVRAPAGPEGRWIVAERLVEPGEMVQPGGQVVSLADPGRAELRIYLGETAVAKVRIGAKASVFLDSDPSTAIPATVASVAKSAEFTPKNVQTSGERAKLVYAVVLRVANPGDLKSGMPAVGSIEVGN
ncbi:MAG TPA: HlyD family efflux transporter periplasmic adaptor subunit [Fibrobacteria bacterium]|nr:HlyD family efflux transporter periplasmic adaptor subunit [Fibrobacteria bacterium]HOX52373.1 HlyD family efflux transporter periplasmic adaptor subunit [Fibrobacteria bacterium]